MGKKVFYCTRNIKQEKMLIPALNESQLATNFFILAFSSDQLS